jgi:hypothetical protein
MCRSALVRGRILKSERCGGGDSQTVIWVPRKRKSGDDLLRRRILALESRPNGELAVGTSGMQTEIAQN